MSMLFFSCQNLIILTSYQHCTNGLPLEPRLNLIQEWNSYNTVDLNGAGTYNFGYDLEDPISGNVQYRKEQRFPNGSVVGSYGLIEPDGNVKVVEYVADHLGYRAKVSGTRQRYASYHPPKTSRIKDNVIPINSNPHLLSFLQPIETVGQYVEEQRRPPKYNKNWSPHLYKRWSKLDKLNLVLNYHQNDNIIPDLDSLSDRFISLLLCLTT